MSTPLSTMKYQHSISVIIGVTSALLLLLGTNAKAGLILQHPTYTGLNQGLVGYWSFDGKDMAGVKAYDRSGLGNDGTLTNGPASAKGRIGQALSFDGVNDRVAIADPFYSNAMTVSAWIYMRTAPTTQPKVIVSKFGAVTDEWQVFVSSVSSKSIEFDQVNSIGTTEAAAGNTAIQVNRWYHIVGVADSSTISVYIDGVNEDRQPKTITLLDSTNPVTIGSCSDDGGCTSDSQRFFDGLIDDVRIYNRALSADEIKRLYKIGGTVHVNTQINNDSLSKGLVGWWSFDGKDMAGVKAYDRSGQGNDGTLTNGPASAKGRIGQALNFDGADDSISTNISSIYDINGTSPITVSTWVKLTATAATVDFLNIVTVSETASPSSTYDKQLALNSTGKFVFHVWDGASKDAISDQANDMNWHHLVGIFDGSSSYLYVDGNKQTITAIPSSTFNFTNPRILIGGKTGLNQYFSGSIDDVRVYNRALSGDEIKRLYKIGATLKVNTSINNDSLSKGLVGYWSFDGKDMAGVKAYDRSGQGNDGTLTNGPASAKGRIGQGLSFDGVDDYVNVGKDASLNTLSTVTVCAWIYPKGWGGGNFGRIYDKGSTFVFSVDNSGVPPDKDITLIIAHNPTNLNVQSSSDSIVLNQWQHVCSAWTGGVDASSVTLYINGTEPAYGDQTSGSGSRNSDSAFDAAIGNRATDGARAFDGLIDDVRVYNRALSGDEIKRLYNLGR
ncbi:MAG: LamG domain-containing protein [bacterium]|nr:LamG domain-containing protein [bacterium]